MIESQSLSSMLRGCWFVTACNSEHRDTLYTTFTLSKVRAIIRDISAGGRKGQLFQPGMGKYFWKGTQFHSSYSQMGNLGTSVTVTAINI